MSTATHLAACVSALASLAANQTGTIADLTQQNASLQTALATAPTASASGITEDQAQSLITTIQGVTGPVQDPGDAPVATPAEASGAIAH